MTEATGGEGVPGRGGMSSALPSLLSSLLRPEAYPHPVSAVHLVETHVSWVFLTGQIAYKIKRPVHYPFLDLRSRERRAFFCAEELRLNRRFAPELYVDVCSVTLDDGVARISGRGEIIDHAVRMRQFRAEEELDQLLATGAVTPLELEGFGRELAALHERLPTAGPGERWGQPHRVRRLLLDNLAECQRAAERFGAAEPMATISEALITRLDSAHPWMARRCRAGRMRECHGDLHARNVVRWGERLVAFDCIEFEPDFRWIDVAADIAFLFMDLDARRCPEHAHALLNGYLSQSGDYEACRVLRLYAADRALVRAKVSALQAAAPGQSGDGVITVPEHSRYLECAQRMLTPGRPLLILTCGISGSGKTWLARQLAARLHAVHVRSDIERKRMGGRAGRRSSPAALGRGLYSGQASREVYDRLGVCAAAVLAGGYPVVVDATFHRREDRARLHALGAQHGAAVRVIFCHAPRDVLQRRISARRQSGVDASEADLPVLEWQEKRFEPICPEENLAVIDADTTAGDVMSRVQEQLTEG